jgi:hypothetical protein
MARTFRTKFLDPDFRRVPKTAHWCVMCQRDLKPGQKHREVRWELDRWEAIHPEDWEVAAVEIPRARPEYAHPENLIERGFIGLDCAKKLGLEWSVPA